MRSFSERGVPLKEHCISASIEIDSKRGGARALVERIITALFHKRTFQ